jgi:hypothetical protein
MALAPLRCGDRVARAGWNGKGMSLEYGEPESVLVYGGTDGRLEELSWLTAFIVMRSVHLACSALSVALACLGANPYA